MKQIFRSAIMTSIIYLNSSIRSRDTLLPKTNTPRWEIFLTVVITRRQFSCHLRRQQLLLLRLGEPSRINACFICSVGGCWGWSHLTRVFSFREVLQKTTNPLNEPILTLCRSQWAKECIVFYHSNTKIVSLNTTCIMWF